MKRKGMQGIPGGHRHLLAVALYGISGTAAAAPLWYEAGEVDTSAWECNYCPYQTGLEGEISFGIGYVDRDDYHFGNYTGLDEQGSYVVLGADLFYRGEDASYWQLNATRLGLDSRSLRFEGGRQGSYRARIDYTEIPRLYSNSAQTPFLGVGTDHLRLPGDWVEAGSTDTMIALDNSLHTVEVRTDRKRFGAALNFTPNSRWTYSANFRQDRKEGLKTLGGSFVFRSAMLLEPVDYTTDQMELGVGYQADHWQLQLGYLGSFFRNGNQRLRWDNPFSEPLGNANEGQMALAPDNSFHQLTLNGNYRFSPATQATLRIAGGQMLQNENFLPYTVNPALAGGVLPRNSMEGEVRTLTVDARLASALTEKFSLQTDLRLNERDNRTPVDTFDYISTDAFSAGTRSNPLYQHTDRRIEFSGLYRPVLNTRLSAGVEYEEKWRSDAEVEETQETTLWAKVAARPTPTSDVTLGLAHADRDASAYRPLGTAGAAQNPLLVKFNLAAREQQRAEMRLHFAPLEQLSFGFELTYRDNNYKDTSVGLLASTDTILTLDATLFVSRELSFHAFTTRERHDNEQAGSQNYDVADWFATAEDLIASHGIGAAWRPADGEIEIGVDYVYSAATGKIGMRGEMAYPDLKTRIHSAKAHMLYQVSESLSTELSLFYEQFSSDDWSVDNVAPDSIPSVLTLGSDSADYRNRALVLALHYRFC